ncbi:hypothetical protein N8D31_15385 (plasmid) [Enterococcus faecium]
MHHPPIEDGRLLPNSVKAYLKVVKAKEICREVNLSNTTISELKNGRKNLDTLKFRSFEALYVAAKKYFTADNK